MIKTLYAEKNYDIESQQCTGKKLLILHKYTHTTPYVFYYQFHRYRLLEILLGLSCFTIVPLFHNTFKSTVSIIYYVIHRRHITFILSSYLIILQR